MEKHRDANETLRICAEHVDHQLPNDRTIVANLLESIETANPGFLSAVSLIKLDDPGMRDDFERAITLFLPTYPVKKKGEKRPYGNISDVTVKAGKVSSGVEFRFYPTP